MGESSPVIYLLDGENEFAIHGVLTQLVAKLGDPSIAALNVTPMDGRTSTLEDLRLVTSAMPFLASRRLVILSHPTHRLNSEALRKRFTNYLDEVPPTTALVLVEFHLLTEDRDRKKGGIHWLEKWAQKAKTPTYIKHFPLPVGPAFVKWIGDQAKLIGGQFTPQGAIKLAEFIGDDTRLASQEIHKLLAYVNYSRPVEADDVYHLTAFAAGLEDFALVNALRRRDRRKTQEILRRMLEKDDPLPILHNIVQQYRLLLLAREALEFGRSEEEIARRMKVHAYPVRLAMEQARNIPLDELELIYHRLLEVDKAIKSGQMPGDLALEILIVELTK